MIDPLLPTKKSTKKTYKKIKLSKKYYYLLKTAELEDLSTQLDNILRNIKKQNPPTTQSEILKKLTDLNEKIDDLIELYLPSTSDTNLNIPTNNIEALMLKAKLLENLAEFKRSNVVLEQAISTYHEVLLMGHKVPENNFKNSGDKCIKLMKFRGWNGKAIRILQMLIQRFSDNHNQDVEYRKQLGVTFLSMNNNRAAKEVFEVLIEITPHDYYVQAHLGFIVKAEALEASDDEKLQNAVDLLEFGIKNQVENGVDQPLDGLFYFHLGGMYA